MSLCLVGVRSMYFVQIVNVYPSLPIVFCSEVGLDQRVPSVSTNPLYQRLRIRGERDVDSLDLYVRWDPKYGSPLL